MVQAIAIALFCVIYGNLLGLGVSGQKSSI